MNTKEEILEELGLSRNESKIYLKLLEIGSATGGKVAEATKIHRPNAYEALDRLVNKGLARYIIVDKTKMFEAVDPSSLTHIVHRKFELLDSIMPELTIMTKMKPAQNAASIHEGLVAFRNLLYNMLEYNQDILTFGIPVTTPNQLRYFIEAFHKERIRKKVWMKHIYNEDAKERIAYLNSLPYTGARHLPKKYNSPASTLVCGKDVLLIMWQVPPIVIVRVQNEELAESYKNYFELLWKKSVI